MNTGRLAASPYTGAPFTVPPAVVPGIMPAVLYLDDPNVKAMHGLAHNCAQKTVMSGVMGFGLGGLFGLFTASMAYDTPFHALPPVPAPVPAPAPGPGSVTTAAAGMTGQPPAATPPTLAAAPKPIPAAPAPTPAATLLPPPGAAAAAAASAKPRPVAAALTAPALVVPAAPAPPVLVPISSLPMREQLRHGFRDMGSRSYSMARSFGKVGALFAGIECGVEGLRARNDATNGVVAGCLTGGVLALGAGPQAAAGGCVAFAAFSAAIEAWLRSDSAGDD